MGQRLGSASPASSSAATSSASKSTPSISRSPSAALPPPVSLPASPHDLPAASPDRLAGLGLPGPAEPDPGTLAGDQDDEHEDNTFNLPEGRPVRQSFQTMVPEASGNGIGQIPTIGAPLPDSFKPLADYTDPMASAMTPLISSYWDEAGKTTRGRLGLDPDEWRVHDPHLHAVIKDTTFKFCEKTNQTTDQNLAEALGKLQLELIAGVVRRGSHSRADQTRAVRLPGCGILAGRDDRPDRNQQGSPPGQSDQCEGEWAFVLAKKWLYPRTVAIAAELSLHAGRRDRAG